MAPEATIDKKIDTRIIRIKLIDETQINGQLNIRRIPGHDRLSDLVSYNDEPFLIVFNAIVYLKEAEKPVKHKTIFVNKKHIIWAIPEDDQK